LRAQQALGDNPTTTTHITQHGNPATKKEHLQEDLKAPDQKGGDNMTINRDEFYKELILREHIRKRILKKHNEQMLEEQKFRKVVRMMLKEAGNEETPHASTGINVLADLLKKIIPVIETDYKMLTTSPEQRESYRAHIIQAAKNAMAPVDVVSDIQSESFEYTIDADVLLEKVTIEVGDEDENEELEGEFIDIDDEPVDEEGELGIDGQNETGRNFALETFKKIESQIVDAYAKLSDDEDNKLFHDYLLTNLLLYFDKFEDQLAEELPEQSTPEYEEEISGEDEGGLGDDGGDLEDMEL